MRAPANTSHPILLWAWGLLRLDFVGVAFGAFFFCLSLTPSLLPRDWLFQGIIGGVNAAIGYAIGVLVGKAFHRMVFHGRTWWPPPKRVLNSFKVATVVLSGAAALLMLIPAAAWQRQVSAIMGMPGPETPAYLRTVLASLLVGGTCVAVSRIVLDAIKVLARWAIRRWHVHQEVALAIGTTVVVIIVITLINGVLYRGFLAGASYMFQPQNSETREGVSPPQRPERSGSPDSLAPWDTLGYEGRNFVANGPHVDELTRVNGAPAKEPIRVYAGLQTADTDEGRMDVIAGELERTGAFDRKLLVVVPTTGTGWVNPVAARAIETMYNGDTAMVAVQYSYLPSWISFLGDSEKSMDSGRLLVHSVHELWKQQPEDARPTLVLYGESLGSMAGQAAFGWLPDIARMDISAVLWVGPPHESPLWSGLVQRRDPGTTEVDPRYDDGSTVRFTQAVDPADVARIADQPWSGTRVLFLQHSSDPIIWWSPNLLFNRPDWLIEAPGADRTSAMRWYPIITFWQVGADVTNANSVPAGHGHNYGYSVLDGWVAVAPPDGWTSADTERVRASMKEAFSNGGPEY